jgi:signal peptidase I
MTGWAYALRRGQTVTAAPRRSFVVGRRIGSFLVWTLTGLATGVALALLVPLAFHARPLTVMSGSMEPTISTGDVVVSRQVSPLDTHPGDVVSFRDPERGGLLVTHRIRSMRRQGDKVVFVTKGDANNSSERWRVGTGDTIGRSLFRLPALGRGLAFAHTRNGILLFVLIPLALMGVLELTSIWRSHDEEEASGEDAS